eukprot:Pgem_evm1s9842
MSGGKGKKKKWSNGTTLFYLTTKFMKNFMTPVLFNDQVYEKLYDSCCSFRASSYSWFPCSSSL